jgi:hypothetical protein
MPPGDSFPRRRGIRSLTSQLPIPSRFLYALCHSIYSPRWLGLNFRQANALQQISYIYSPAAWINAHYGDLVVPPCRKIPGKKRDPNPIYSPRGLKTR